MPSLLLAFRVRLRFLATVHFDVKPFRYRPRHRRLTELTRGHIIAQVYIGLMQNTRFKSGLLSTPNVVKSHDILVIGQQGRSNGAMPERSLAHLQWLTLEQASKRLGVHPTTLRRWADGGDVNVFVTPGGHRRFFPADLDRFVIEHQHSGVPARGAPAWTDHAIAQARENLREQRWLASYDETERESQRYLGRRLMGLVLQYIAHPSDNPELLAEARVIGVQHAQNALEKGRTLPDLLQAISFFRATLLEVVLQEAPQSGKGRCETNVHLLRRIERLVSEVQGGVVELYTGEGQRR